MNMFKKLSENQKAAYIEKHIGKGDKKKVVKDLLNLFERHLKHKRNFIVKRLLVPLPYSQTITLQQHKGLERAYDYQDKGVINDVTDR
eukprot:UN18599